MKLIVEVDFPLDTYVRQGAAGEKTGEALGVIKFAMSAGDLQSAGLDRYATA
jgi:hypothetical protein